MTSCNCIVQEGEIPPATEADLRRSLQAFSRRAFGSDAEISWLTVPRGNGFTAGEPTKASVVSLRSEVPLEQGRREFLLKELCDLWIRETQCSIDELVGVIADPPTT